MARPKDFVPLSKEEIKERRRIRSYKLYLKKYIDDPYEYQKRLARHTGESVSVSEFNSKFYSMVSNNSLWGPFNSRTEAWNFKVSYENALMKNDKRKQRLIIEKFSFNKQGLEVWHIEVDSSIQSNLVVFPDYEKV